MSINTILAVAVLISIVYFLGKSIYKFIKVTIPRIKAKIQERNNKK